VLWGYYANHTAYPAVLGAQTPRLFGLDSGLLRVQTYWQLAGRGSIVKRLTVAILVFGLFTPTVFAQTAEQKEVISPSCVEIIRGTQKQCDNVITPTPEQTGEKSLPGRKGGKAQAKLLTAQQRKASATSAKARRSTPNSVLFVVPVPGRQIRDFEDSPEGPITSVAR